MHPSSKQASHGEDTIDIEDTRKRQEAACLKDIHAAHAGPTLDVGTAAQWQSRTQARAWITTNFSVAKFSPSGKLIGFYRIGQRCGKPNRHTSAGQKVIAAFEKYADAMHSISNKKHRATILGKKSGQGRRKKGYAELIIAENRGLLIAKIPKHHCAKTIARKLNCSLDYVRRVLRREGKRSTLQQPAIKKVT